MSPASPVLVGSESSRPLCDDEIGRLYAQYGFLVHRRCLALLRNSADADDALQETFLRARRYGGARPPTALGWLYTIAAHCSFDLMARRSRESPQEPAVAQAMVARSHGSPDDSDRRALLGAVLRQLDEKTRTIGILHYLDGFTQEEVAERTGFSRRTVGKKLRAFEELFRKVWSDQSPEERP